METRVGTPYYAVYHRTYVNKKPVDTRIPGQVTRLSYCHAEEDDDACDIEVRSDNPKIVDEPCFKNNAHLVVEFGYRESPSKSFKESVYIEDINPTFSEKGVSIKIIAHDKLTAAKKSTARTVYKNATFPEIARDIATKHNLDVKLEKPKDKVTPKPTDNFQAWVNSQRTAKPDIPYLGANASKQIVKKAQRHEEYIKASEGEYNLSPSQRQAVKKQNMAMDGFYLNTPQGQGVKQLVIDQKLDPTKVGEYLYFRNKFVTHSAVPQANRTDRQLLKSLAMRQPGGPYLVSGHGNTMVIRKRNFNQTPLTKYKWADGQGELITFSPETKNKSAQAAASAVGYMGWNPLDKQVYGGTITDGNNPFVDTYLGNGGVNNAARNNTVLPNNKTYDSPNYTFKKGTSGALDITYGANYKSTDATGVFTKKVNPQAPEETPTGKVEKRDSNIQIISPSLDPAGNYPTAANTQANDSLRRNPGSCTVVGNPLLKSGKLITIENVGKRYSTNYYMTKVTHEIEPGNGFITTVELCTNTGGSTKETSTEITPKPVTEAINNTKPPSNLENTKKLKTNFE